jgi:uncharacterized protein (TIGR02246 family)
MTDPETTAGGILRELQDAIAAKDLDWLARLFADDVVVFGTAAESFDRSQTMAYLARVVAQEGTIRWEWNRVAPLVSVPGLLSFAVVGTVGFDDEVRKSDGDRYAFRLTCVAVEEGGRWRLRHFHGSVPQEG